MKRKYIITRVVNLLLVLVLLLSYQIIANQRADKQEAAAINEKEQMTSSPGKESKTSSPYKDGTYEGSAEGYGGQVVMKVTVKNGRIDEVKDIQSSGEDASYWGMAKKIIPQIVERQDPNVDTVSGATYSSEGIINATKKALQEAVK